jgi:hypothetical protein
VSSPFRIVLNYRRDDTAGHAGRLYEDLAEKFGSKRVFMDIDTIEPGVDFPEVIEQAVGSADVLLALIGRRWLSESDSSGHRRLDNAHDFVRLEIEAALRQGLRVIPVLVQDAQMPGAEALPESLAPLARRNALEIRDVSWRYDVDRLLETLERVARGKQDRARPRRESVARERIGSIATRLSVRLGSRRRMFVAAATAGALAAAIVITVGLTRGDNNGAAQRAASTPVSPPQGLPALPAGWPRELRLGLTDDEDAQRFKATIGPGIRADLLAGDPETLAAVKDRANLSLRVGSLPVFVWTVLLTGVCDACYDMAHTLGRLNDPGEMKRWFSTYKRFLTAAATVKGQVVLHVEPDLWGYAQLKGNPDQVPVALAATRLPELRGEPDNLAGFSRAVVFLRDRYAPNVLLGWNLREWGAGANLFEDNPPPDELARMATSASRYYHALGARYDLAFFSASNGFDSDDPHRDSSTGAWPPDAENMARYLRMFVQQSGLRVVLDLLPLGNRRMRAMNNTSHHYQDDRVEWYLGPNGRTHLLALSQAGVIGLIFGGLWSDDSTCACDRAHDGITNPEPIGSNTTRSYNADDDGGLFRHLANEYSRQGTLPL